jgi:regulator of protease activity HflC (stomatin/prohibitin superfamily)
MIEPNMWVPIAIGVVVLWSIFKGFFVVSQASQVIIERLGKYRRTLHSGVNWIWPFFDKPRPVIWLRDGHLVLSSRVDMRECVLDVPEQNVITKDNVAITIDALMYVQATDPVRVAYEVNNAPNAASQLAQTSLRALIGEMELDETLSSRDMINQRLKAVLDEASDKWGLKVNRVEVKNISPPHEIQVAMEKQMQAERDRRAKILEAEGDKQSRIARSEGQKQESINLAQGEKESAILRAEGQAQAIAKVAEAQAIAITSVSASIGDKERTVQYLLGLRYLDQFGQIAASSADRVFVPYEASAALGALGMVRELLTGGDKAPGQKPAGVKL